MIPSYDEPLSPDDPLYDLEMSSTETTVTEPLPEEPLPEPEPEPTPDPEPEPDPLPEPEIPVYPEEEPSSDLIEPPPPPMSKPLPSDYDTVAEDVNWDAPWHLTTNIAGSSMNFEAFIQALGSNDAPKMFQPQQDEVYQQYTRYSNLELKLQGELSFEEEQDTGEVTITGTFRSIPGTIKPNYGDVFVGDANGQLVAFCVQERPRRLSRFKVPSYEFTLKSVWYYDQIKPKLLGRVVNHYYYSREHLNQNGMVHASDREWLMEIESSRRLLVDSFFERFYDAKTRTFILYKDGQRLYDENVTNIMHALYPHHEYPDVTQLDCGTPRMPVKTVYTQMWERIPKESMHLLHQQFRWVHKRMSAVPMQYASIRYAPLDNFAWSVTEPTMEELALEQDRYLLRENLQPPLPLAPEPREDTPEIEYVSNSTVKSPSVDFYYVLSAAWYQRIPSHYSRLETLLSAYIDGKVFPLESLLDEIRELLSGDCELERAFYHTALVIMLINVAARR